MEKEDAEASVASNFISGSLQDGLDGWAGYQEAVYRPTYILKMYVGR